MEPKDVLSAIVDGSGMSQQSLSLKMGRARTFINSTMQRKSSTPRMDTMAEIADVCGYDFKLEKRDGSETIIIDPPRKE